MKKFLLTALTLTLGLVCTSFTNKTEVSNYNENSIVLNTRSEETAPTDLGTLNTDLKVSFLSLAVTDLTASFQIVITYADEGDRSANYYVGYFGEGEMYLPSSLSFKVKTSDGKIEERTAPLNKAVKNNLYDGIGPALGPRQLNTFCDIPLNDGEEVLYEEPIYLYNIFSFDGDTKTADFENPSYAVCDTYSITSSAFKTNFKQRELFDLNYTGSSSFSGFSTFTFEVQSFGTEMYPTLSALTAQAYRSHERNIERGDYYIKTSLSFGGDTLFDVYYNDGTMETITSTSKICEITYNQPLVLLLENVDARNVTNVQIRNIYYQTNLFDVTTNRNIVRTEFLQRFGTVYTHMSDLVDTNGNVSTEGENDYRFTSVDLIIFLIFAISTLGFFGIVIPSYFYLKKKNRNDEFKRMNTKAYWTTATYGYLCIESVLLVISFIAIRGTLFNNSLVVYNPTDAYIVVFGVAAIILIGYFIRYFVIMIKNNMEKKRRDQLKINQDVMDDGTLIIKK